MNLKIKEKELIFFLMIIPFFPLYSLEMLGDLNSGFSIAFLIRRLLSVGRWGLSAFAFAYFLRKKIELGIVTRSFILFSAMRILASVCNGHFAIGILIGNVTYIGFAILVEILIKKNENAFLDSNRILFTILVGIGILTVIIMPNGFNNSVNKADAIYFLGSKNSGFYYYVACVFFIALNAIIRKKKYLKSVSVICILSILASILTSSANTLIAFLILLCYFVSLYFIRNNKLIKPKYIFIVVMILGWYFLFGQEIDWINSVLGFLGRNSSFTGRDFIWEKNLVDFSKSPLWGLGFDYTIILPSGVVANHAHNFFLDNLVKYGWLEFIALILLVISAGIVISNKKSKSLCVFYSTILFVVLLHSLMDDMMIYMLILFFICFERIGECKKNKIDLREKNYEIK